MARVPLDRQVEEASFVRVVARELSKQRRAVLEIAKRESPQLDELFWEEHRVSMEAALIPVLVGIYDRAVGKVELNIKQDYIGELASRAYRWARSYAGELVRGITQTSQRIVRGALADFVSTPGMTTRDLRDILATTFGPARAQTIAVTETTRAYYEGGKEAASEIEKLGFEMVGIWRTANDERVCPICAPLNGKPEKEWGGLTPPAHPNCRCDVAYELT
jgi:SPP1 gp7 family putative phage head morphogenesis protein